MIDTNSKTLHMVHLCLDPLRLARLGKMLHLPLAQTRTNYLVHCALGELFQDQAPQPFSIESGPERMPTDEDQCQNQRAVRVLGYGEVPDGRLQELARGFSSPSVYKICDWEQLASKPMPTSFQEGQRLQFELRACPVIRKASSGPKWEEGQELDAFLSRAWENPDEELEREQVYREWLTRQFDLRGGAQINPSAITMDRFSIERMTRRTHGDNRSVRVIQRPDVTFTGRFTVTDSDEFVALLRSGIGRHKSFGFGMLKVRPAT